MNRGEQLPVALIEQELGPYLAEQG
jgi:hypothetical protein